MNSVTFVGKDSQSFVHFSQVVSQLFHVFTVFQRVLAVWRDNVAKDVLVLVLDLVGQGDHLAIHVLHFLFNLFFQHVQTGFLLFALSNCLANLLIILNVAIGQDGLELLFILRKLLFISAFIIRKMPELLFFLFVLTSAPDASLKNAQQFVTSFLFVFSRAQQIGESLGSFTGLEEAFAEWVFFFEEDLDDAFVIFELFS